MCNIIYLCPTTTKHGCEWEGNASEIQYHFAEMHSDLLLDSNTFTVDVTEDCQENRLLESKTGLYLVQTKVCVKTFKLLIRLRFLQLSTKETSKTTYSIDVSNGSHGFTNENGSDIYNPVCNSDGGVEIDFQAIGLIAGVKCIENVTLTININEATAAEDFNVLPKCFNLPESTIVSTEHPSTFQKLDTQEKLNRSEISLDNHENLPEKFNQSQIVYDNQENDTEKLSLSQNLFEKLDDAVQNLRHEDIYSDNHNILENITKCVNCLQIMLPPIYLCSKGHSVCHNCKHTYCSVCNKQITDVRNIELEEYSKMLEYPCKYELQGCPEKHGYGQIRKHEVQCRFCLYSCVLCRHEGRYWDTESHFRIAHPSTRVYETMSGISFPKGSNFAIINMIGVFYCTSRATDTYVEWIVIFCGPRERCFSCEVRLMGKKQYQQAKSYFLARVDNLFRWTVPMDEFKLIGVKEKYARLFISSY